MDYCGLGGRMMLYFLIKKLGFIGHIAGTLFLVFFIFHPKCHTFDSTETMMK